MAEDVLVIGAGPAGIASAYFLECAGISYRVVDKANEIGSTWNSLYPSLRLNTSRFFSHLPGKRFPLSYGLFPTGKQYHRYLLAYVKEHNFNIDLGVEIYNIRQDGQGWCVESSEGSEWYPAVISATGRFNSPYIPKIRGMDTFKGQIIHAQDYLGPEPYIGKRVMVVGNGPSGVDIVSELAYYAKTPALLSQRTGVILRPRYPFGLPKHLWMIISEYLPDFISKPMMSRILDLKYENLGKIGIKVPRTKEESSAAGGTRGKELINAVKRGQVKSVDGPVLFDGYEVELQDGSRYEVDAVIMATGYVPVVFQYADIEVEMDDQGWPVRIDSEHDGKRQVKNYKGLYLVGVYYVGKGAMYNFNVEARIAVEEIKAHLAVIKR